MFLRPQAQSGDLTGLLTRTLPTGHEYLVWRYTVIRLWQLNPQAVIENPGLTPLAPLCDIKEAELPRLAHELTDRWSRLPSRQARDLIAATNVLMGLRFDRATIRGLFKRAGTMSLKESVIYQEILEEGSALGELKRARLDLIRFGQKRLGVPDAATRERIQSCTDLGRLDRMLDRVLEAPDWATLLATE